MSQIGVANIRFALLLKLVLLKESAMHIVISDEKIFDEVKHSRMTSPLTGKPWTPLSQNKELDEFLRFSKTSSRFGVRASGRIGGLE